MGRKPIGRKAMAPAERQRRRRAKVKRKLIAAGSAEDKAERRKRRLAKRGERIVPMPPGITYWREVTISTPEGPVQTWAPITQPAAGVALLQLTDAEIDSLIDNLTHELARREGKRPPTSQLEDAAFLTMLMSRPGHYLNRLEMNARKPRAGWDIWGAEVCISLGLM